MFILGSSSEKNDVELFAKMVRKSLALKSFTNLRAFPTQSKFFLRFLAVRAAVFFTE
jgi:hypothetical protein